MTQNFTVIGAGSVGIGTAMHLQQRGFHVTLIDRKLPASETSYGNAGVVNNSSYIPLNNPALISKLPKLLLNRSAYLRYNLAYVLRNIPWCYQFLRHCTTAQSLKTAQALNSLISEALDEHRALMQRAGNMNRLSQTGWLKLYRGEGSLDPGGYEATLFDEFNISYDRLSRDDIAQLEPDLKPIFSSGYLLASSASVNNPGQLLREYVEQFLRDGGEFTQGPVNAITEAGNRFTLKVGDNDVEVDNLVVCAGPWSGDLLSSLGYRVLLGVERGYHQHFNLLEGASLKRPIHDIERGYILAPMDIGIRLTTGVELNDRDADSNLAQLKQVLPSAREAIPLGEPTVDPVWRGCRPTFPDSRPVIDQAPRHDNLWVAFGHQHIGLMSGPVTGKLLTQKICNEITDIDLDPFRASRWIS